MSMYSRSSYIIRDELGNDPLSSRLPGILLSVPMVKKYTLVREDAYRPDTISRKLFGTVELDWLIMEYNNVAAIQELRVGLVINVPDLPALNAALVSVLDKQKLIRTIKIK